MTTNGRQLNTEAITTRFVELRKAGHDIKYCLAAIEREFASVAEAELIEALASAADHLADRSEFVRKGIALDDLVKQGMAARMREAAFREHPHFHREGDGRVRYTGPGGEITEAVINELVAWYRLRHCDLTTGLDREAAALTERVLDAQFGVPRGFRNAG